MEKYLEQLKEGDAELLKEMYVRLWWKKGIPRYVESFTPKTSIAGIESKLAEWSVMATNDKSLLMLF